MKVTGIIAEYNPFHNGHLYHLNQARAQTGADYVVCVMSGNFTQRGEPALWDKWSRAEMAVNNGVDLVLELPFMFACNNAQSFAYGAMEILERLGCVTDLVFGSECGELEPLSEAAQILWEEPAGFRVALRKELDKGVSFPTARASAMESIMGSGCRELLKNPNNILGMEYLKQAKRLGSTIGIHTIRREGQGYHELESGHRMASASSIRNQLKKSLCLQDVEGAVPIQTLEVMKRFDPIMYGKMNELDRLLRYQICISEGSSLQGIYSVTEGLENRLKKAVLSGSGMEELIRQLKSKRYTHTRICRVLCHVLTDFLREDFERAVEEKLIYGRVLGFNEKGAELLHMLKKEERCQMPLITNLKKRQLESLDEGRVLKYDVRASDIYNLVFHGEIYPHSDFVTMPFMTKKQKKD